MSEALSFDTPEHAMMFGFPERYCRVVASAVDGDDAYVLLDTGSDGRSYFYGGWCRRRNGRWLEGASSNGGGWTTRGSDSGMLAFWEEAPASVDAVRVQCLGEVQEVKVQGGAYLAVWWNVPDSESAWPRVDAFRRDGKWIPRG